MAETVPARACVPTRSILDLEAASVIARMKDKAFARTVSRDDLRMGAEELGLPLETHEGNVIRFMRERADALGLRGTFVREASVDSRGWTAQPSIGVQT